MTAAATASVELVLARMFDENGIIPLPAEMSAIANGLLLGAIVGPLFFLLSSWSAVARGHVPFRARALDAATISVMAAGFEGVLHTPFHTLMAGFPPVVGAVVGALIVAIVLGSVATWLVFVRLRVAAHGKPLPKHGRIGAVLVAGALLAATFVSAIPALSVFNNMMSWERTRGSGDLINVAGRQRMLSQMIGRLALMDVDSNNRALTEAIEIAHGEGARVDSLARGFVASFVPDGDQAAGLAQIDDLAFRRNEYLETAKAFVVAPDNVARKDINSRLQTQIDAFLVAMDAGVLAIQQLADSYSDRQVAVIPLRLTLGTVILFCAVLGLIWPILRLVAAQQWKLEARWHEAEAAVAAKAQFLANMSHELRAPLTAVLGFGALLEKQSELSSESRRILDRVSFGGRALLSTINDLLDFSTLEAGRVTIASRAVDAGKLFEETLSLFEAQANAKGIELALSREGQLPRLLVVDPDRLRQVLMNLLGNALKFTDTGRVDLAVRYDPAEGKLHVAVTDTGLGISEEGLNKLFLRFSQVDGSATRRHGGTGLGLAICRGLVEAMEGEVGVTSKIGSGSTFWFNLPVSGLDQVDTDSDEWERGHLSLQGCRILVVDDNEASRQLATTILQAFGCEPVGATSGAGALALANCQPFDAILLDMQMPDLSGDAVAREIRNGDGLNANIPMLAFTANPSRAVAPELYDGHVSKPFTPAELLAKLEQALNVGGDIANAA